MKEISDFLDSSKGKQGVEFEAYFPGLQHFVPSAALVLSNNLIVGNVSISKTY